MTVNCSSTKLQTTLQNTFPPVQVVQEPEFDITADDDRLDESKDTLRKGLNQTNRTASDEVWERGIRVHMP